MINASTENLHKCLWFGILERIDQSIELLQFQTGLKLKFGHSMRRTKPKASQQDIRKLRKLMPVDLYIYEYAKRLFDHRWNLYLQETKETRNLSVNNHNSSTQNSLLTLPGVIDGCISTSSFISCPNGTRLP